MAPFPSQENQDSDLLLQRTSTQDFREPALVNANEKALTLSGGGYRAALFHLGALQRLNELGLLSQIDAISSVSGGSIISAHLAQVIHSQKIPTPEDWTKVFAEPFYRIVRRDIRTLPILFIWSGLILIVLWFVATLMWTIPWYITVLVSVLSAFLWSQRNRGGHFLAKSYYRHITRLPIHKLPITPKFIFCATDMAFGTCWIQTRDKIGDYQMGYAKPPEHLATSFAVAASSCFPPIFSPMSIHPKNLVYLGGKYKGSNRSSLEKNLSLTDGGVYDNLGLEPVWKDKVSTILVSDGGGPLAYVNSTAWLSQVSRYSSIIQNQVLALRKRILISKFISHELKGTYWGLSSSTDSYPAKPSIRGYSRDFVEKWIAPIRTDLAYFSPEEVGVLVNHGYSLTEAAIQSYDLKFNVAEKPFVIPFSKLMNEHLAEQFLQQSNVLISFKRLWQSFGSWKSYLATLESYT